MTHFLSTSAETRLFHRMATRNYHLIENLLISEKVNVNVCGGNITPLQYLMDSLTVYPKKTKKQTKKEFLQKLHKTEFGMVWDVEVFNLLVRHGLDLSVRDRNNNSYLLTAASKGRPDMMEALVKAGLPVNKEDIKQAIQATRQNNFPKAEKYLITLNRLRRKEAKKHSKATGTCTGFIILATVLKDKFPLKKKVQNQQATFYLPNRFDKARTD